MASARVPTVLPMLPLLQKHVEPLVISLKEQISVLIVRERKGKKAIAQTKPENILLQCHWQTRVSKF